MGGCEAGEDSGGYSQEGPPIPGEPSARHQERCVHEVPIGTSARGACECERCRSADTTMRSTRHLWPHVKRQPLHQFAAVAESVLGACEICGPLFAQLTRAT